MSTKSETAITREPTTFLSKKDRALFDRARARADAIAAERGNLDDQPAPIAIHTMGLFLLRVGYRLMEKTPAEVEEFRKQAVAERMADPTGDAAILAKFADWCTAEDAYSAALLVDPDDTHLGEQPDEVATEVMQIPAAGAVGLAVKTYLMLFRDGSLPDPETTSIGADALVHDLIRFAPILEPRCRAFLHALDAETSS
jgi:hypothetical protein